MKIRPDVESSGLSVVGLVREDNQDAIFLHDNSAYPDKGLLFAIADGMGGYEGGGIASNLAVTTLARTLFDSNTAIHRALKSGVEIANLGVFNAAQKMGIAHMGTTLTAAYLFGNKLHLAHVGDSRCYLVRKNQAICLTNDHTTVGDMVRAKLIPAAKIRTHANRSILTRAIGLNLFVQSDISQHDIQIGDRIILCSDGVWSMIEDQEFAEISSQLTVEETSKTLVELALYRESDDNASVITFQINNFVSDSPGLNETKNSNWFYKLRNMTR